MKEQIKYELMNETPLRKYVEERYIAKFSNYPLNFAIEDYLNLKDFKINENVFEVNQTSTNQTSTNQEIIPDNVHYLMRLITQFYITKAFKAMKVDMNDPNVIEDLECGNIGTPGRISKVWCGANTNDDTELLGGRWAKEVRLASFPATTKEQGKPIIKMMDLNAVCSHHFLPFSSKLKSNSKIVVAYIPEDIVLGISKLPRVVRQLSQRGWLQEDLTYAIYDRISKSAQTKSVFVGLYNVVHTCEATRGANTSDGGFTSFEWGGKFEDPEMRKIVEQAIQL